MGSENLYIHHHQLQQQQQQNQQQLVYSSLLPPSSAPRVSLTLQDWNHPNSSVLGSDEFNRYMNEVLPNSRDYFWPTKNSIDHLALPSIKRSTLEVVDHHHDNDHAKPSDLIRSYVENSTPNKGICSLSDSFLKLCDPNAGNNITIFNEVDFNSIKNNGQQEEQEEHPQEDGIDLNQNIGLMPEAFGGFSQLCPQNYMPSCCSASATVVDYHHHPNFISANSVVPAVNNLHHHHLAPTNNMMMSSRSYEDEGRSTDHHQPYSGGRILSSSSSDYFQVQQSSHDSPSNSSNKTSTLRKDVGRKEKHPKPTHSSTGEVAKKPRVGTQSSCPTLKVRKEKLGDRIAALHRMVSPFGKTDTASVLTEAMGYIHFLQDQIQRLSLTYLKSSRSSLCPLTRGGRLSMKERQEEEERERQDLKSRGLCLVPLAFTSFVFSQNETIC